MGTVFRTATHPETGDKYQIEFPDPAVIRQAILELPCPPNGMMPKETSKRLAEKLKLSEEQKNAVNPSGESIFWYMVAEGFSYLLQAGKLKQPGGPRTPYFLVDEPATPDQIELPAPAVVRQAITDLSRASAKLNEIAEKSADGDYIYRGESKTLEKVRSSLYSEYEADIEAENFDIAVVQAEILKEAKKYTTHKMDDPEILAELQHHGGKTNLIDFTEDYRVALFFACDSNRDKPGRVILLKKESEDYEVLKPPGTIPHAGVQKSLFVQSPSGVVEPDDLVDIPADLKGIMLDHLQKHHDISTKTIYNDLQGFIENRRTHKSAYTEFYKGLTCQQRGHSERDQAEKQVWYDKAIGHYTDAIELNHEFAEAYYNRGNAYKDKGEVDRVIQDFNTAIKLKPEFAAAYNNRGNAYRRKGELDTAIQDFNTAIKLKPEFAAYYNRGLTYGKKGDFDAAIADYSKAIELKPEFADAYTNRGEAWLHLQQWEKAKADLTTAKDMGSDIVASFHNDYESVENFEALRDVEVPEDIAALLNPHAVDTKPVVLTEGKTDARYILTALELFGEAELLNSLEIRPVGGEGTKGDEGGGQPGLNKVHKAYLANPQSFNHALLLLYDWDANKSPYQIEKLWVRSIPKNSEDADEKSGIENLFPSHLFEDRFYEEKTRKGIHGKSTVYHYFKKQEFCDWICENGTATDFAKFDSIVQILKEFVEAN